MLGGCHAFCDDGEGVTERLGETESFCSQCLPGGPVTEQITFSMTLCPHILCCGTCTRGFSFIPSGDFVWLCRDAHLHKYTLLCPSITFHH